MIIELLLNSSLTEASFGGGRAPITRKAVVKSAAEQAKDDLLQRIKASKNELLRIGSGLQRHLGSKAPAKIAKIFKNYVGLIDKLEAPANDVNVKDERQALDDIDVIRQRLGRVVQSANDFSKSLQVTLLSLVDNAPRAQLFDDEDLNKYLEIYVDRTRGLYNFENFSPAQDRELRKAEQGLEEKAADFARTEEREAGKAGRARVQKFAHKQFGERLEERGEALKEEMARKERESIERRAQAEYAEKAAKYEAATETKIAEEESMEAEYKKEGEKGLAEREQFLRSLEPYKQEARDLLKQEQASKQKEADIAERNAAKDELRKAQEAHQRTYDEYRNVEAQINRLDREYGQANFELQQARQQQQDTGAIEKRLDELRTTYKELYGKRDDLSKQLDAEDDRVKELEAKVEFMGRKIGQSEEIVAILKGFYDDRLAVIKAERAYRDAENKVRALEEQQQRLLREAGDIENALGQIKDAISQEQDQGRITLLTQRAEELNRKLKVNEAERGNVENEHAEARDVAAKTERNFRQRSEEVGRTSEEKLKIGLGYSQQALGEKERKLTQLAGS